MKIPWTTLWIAFALFGGAVSRTQADSYSVDWYKIAGGGVASTGGVYHVTATLGQIDASPTMSGGAYSLMGGFATISVVQTTGLPNLVISRAANKVIVSWPDTVTCRLLQTADLVRQSWTASPYAILTTNGTNNVTINSPTGNLFLRLTSP